MEQRRKQIEEKRPCYYPRAFFTNYTEYLLTGGLSQCLLRPPTHCFIHYAGAVCLLSEVKKLLTPSGKWRIQKKNLYPHKEDLESEDRLAHALISEEFRS